MARLIDRATSYGFGEAEALFARFTADEVLTRPVREVIIQLERMRHGVSPSPPGIPPHLSLPPFRLRQ